MGSEMCIRDSPCSLLALLLYVRSWKRFGNVDNEGGEYPDDPKIICGENF